MRIHSITTIHCSYSVHIWRLCNKFVNKCFYNTLLVIDLIQYPYMPTQSPAYPLYDKVSANGATSVPRDHNSFPPFFSMLHACRSQIWVPKSNCAQQRPA